MNPPQDFQSSLKSLKAFVESQPDKSTSASDDVAVCDSVSDSTQESSTSPEILSTRRGFEFTKTGVRMRFLNKHRPSLSN